MSSNGYIDLCALVVMIVFLIGCAAKPKPTEPKFASVIPQPGYNNPELISAEKAGLASVQGKIDVLEEEKKALLWWANFKIYKATERGQYAIAMSVHGYKVEAVSYLVGELQLAGYTVSVGDSWMDISWAKP